MAEKYLPTGNEYVSLPDLDEKTAALGSVSVLHMGAKGLIELRGGEGAPFMEPFVRINGEEAPLRRLSWSRGRHWIPCFTAEAGPLAVSGQVLACVGERGFIYRLGVAAEGPAEVEYGLRGRWQSSWLCINEDRQIRGEMAARHSYWNGGPVFELSAGLPLLAFAPMWERPVAAEWRVEPDGAVSYSLTRRFSAAPGQGEETAFFWGLGYEEVSAATSAKEMLRRGWDYERERTENWLGARIWRCADGQLERLYNTNMFFCLFYSTGLTLDTEERVLVTSRSPRYYVSAAYWDRDSLLWSFPTLLDADHELAREALLYAFGRQARNIGTHSRYIDGTVLEPGFELDELLAPIIALERYVKATGDKSVLALECVTGAAGRICRALESVRSGGAALYETFLMPTDDLRTYPYLTYDNVLAWRALRALASLWPERCGPLEAEAERVRAAVYEHCTAEGAGGRYFVWSTDMAGGSDVYDEPPGSLLLLPYLGFCASDDPVWRNTVGMIRSPDYAYSFASCEFAEIGCAHAPHPWLLSVGNSLLSGEAERALDFLRRAPLDNGIICESVDEHTGECATGGHFATCAGFVCHALRYALGGAAHEE